MDEPPPNLLLAATVQQFADCPCEQHYDAFLAALAATDPWVVKVLQTTGDRRGPGPHQVGGDFQVSVASTCVDGRTFIVVFPDVHAARREDPRGLYGGIPRDQAIAMALGDPTVDGIYIPAVTDDLAWAAVGRADLAAMLPPTRAGSGFGFTDQ